MQVCLILKTEFRSDHSIILSLFGVPGISSIHLNRHMLEPQSEELMRIVLVEVVELRSFLDEYFPQLSSGHEILFLVFLHCGLPFRKSYIDLLFRRRQILSSFVSIVILQNVPQKP